jgi:ADP-heptose:LPS heptosyltransferase
VIRRNVLILHTGALGDFVLAWPLVLALGRLHPQSRIIVVTHASKGALAEAALRVESADVEQGWGPLLGGDADRPLGERAAKLLEGAHAIYFFAGPAEPIQARAPEAQVMALRTVPPEGWSKHASEWLLEQLAPQAAVRTAVEQILRSVASRGVGTGRSHDGDVVVHPGSGSRAKCWPVERFVELIARLRHARREVRVLIGEVEQERFAAEQIEALEKAAPVRRPHGYVELLNELRSAGQLICNDSGPAHLGGIIGVPTLALFGPTDPAVWRPLGPHVQTLRHEPLEKLGVSKVAAAAKSPAGG